MWTEDTLAATSEDSSLWHVTAYQEDRLFIGCWILRKAQEVFQLCMISDFHLGVNKSVHFTWHSMLVCYQCSWTTSKESKSQMNCLPTDMVWHHRRLKSSASPLGSLYHTIFPFIWKTILIVWQSLFLFRRLLNLHSRRCMHSIILVSVCWKLWDLKNTVRHEMFHFSEVLLGTLW